MYLRGGGEYGTAEQQQQDPATPSLLHRVLETLVFFLIIALRILAPCIRALISTVAVYDRQYGIKERAAELSTAVARKTWAWTAENVDARYLVSLSAEITGGIEEGWRKGSGHVRVRKSTQ